MSNQTGHQKNADGAREAGEQYGNGSQVAKKQVNVLIQILSFLVI